MSFAFECAKQPDGAWPDEQHETSGVMRQCPRCRKWAVAGYQCQQEDCQHEDVDPVDQLAGHGEGHCEPTDGSGEATA